MDEDSPLALADICLAWVSRNLETLCTVCEDGSLQFYSCPVFPQELSDLLLHAMTDMGVLDDRTVGVFRNVERLRLKRAWLHSSCLSADAFRQALCMHRLQELNASCLGGDITVSDILHGLSSNKDCRQGLQRLTVIGMNLLSAASDPSPRFSALRGLRCLCVAWTQLDDSGLEDICSLPLLESLDISGTSVTDLAPLRSLRAGLRSLTVHGLRKLAMPAADLLSVLTSLELLRHLDVSNSRLVADREGLVRQLLERTGTLEELVSLDVSGWRGVSDATVQAFVEARPGMRFLGLLATGAGGSNFLSGEGCLKVTGEHNLAQVNEALRRYVERKSFLQEVLRHLHILISELDVGPQPEVLKLVCSAMQKHSDSASVQLVATACVFNLTSLELAQEMPLSLLGNVVRQVLAAMKNFPSNEQIQKNCLFSLCSDYVLQVVPFNRYETARQVIMSLASYDNETLQRICVAVVSLLVSKLGVEELAQFGGDEMIVKQLLSIVQQRASVGAVDSVLNFALTTLWNLTDERPYTCLLFLQCQGLELYMEVLETYIFEPSTQKKVLGLLNNLAEVEDLRGALLDEELLEYVVSVLSSPAVAVEVSYFAGGVLANLTSSRGPAWDLDTQLRDTILQELHASVLSWTPPDHVMVSYRSFQPFYPLLHHSQASGVQLWALWGIHLVCRHDVSQYSRILTVEGGLDTIRALTSDPHTHRDVQQLALNILTLVEPGATSTAEESVREEPCV
ncbi:protein zyg-11 homolog [Electrophorus electricus]|uniref:protein zyg-11 homolog n=1 Tax=Electrophorus electricus TaxID=8005 RepID=UPI0015D0B487|nr:protein zyg-11 homolog [Electrophorus electricus]